MLPRWTVPKTYLLICASLLLLGGLGLSVVLWIRTFEQIAYLTTLLLFAAAAGALVARGWLRGNLDWFEPGVMMGLLFLLSFGFAGLRYFVNPEALHPLLQGDLKWLTLALLFVFLGMLAFWAGYYGHLGASLHRLTTRPAREQVRARAVVRMEVVVGLYVLGLITRLIMLRAGLYGYLKDPEQYVTIPYAELFVRLEAFCGYALVLAWLDSYSHPGHKGRRWFAWGLLFSEMFWGFFSGMKIFVILPLVLVTMIHAYKRGRLPVRHLAATAAVLVLIYPVNNIYRQMVRGGEVHIRTPADILDSSSALMDEALFSFDDPNLYLGSGYEGAIARTSLTQNYALLLKYLDQTGAYWHGRTLWLLPALVVIPRAVWRDKPVSNTGYWFAVHVWGQDPRINSSVAMTWPGFLHLQFGLPSLLLGMFIVGILFRFLYERYGRSRTDYSLFFYVLILASVLRIDDDLSWLLVAAVRTFFILFAISLLAFRYPRLARDPVAAPQRSLEPVPAPTASAP